MRLLSMILVIMLISGGAGAQNDKLPLETVKSIATEALPVFSELVTKDNFEAMGFESLDDVKNVTLSDAEPPLQVFMVRLDHLKEYRAGDDVNPLLTGGGLAYYPVTINGQVAAAVGVEKMNEKWEATSVGDAALIKMFTSVRRESMDSTRLDANAYFVVWVAALNLHFVAYRADNSLMLIPVQDDDAYEFRSGEAMPAERVFEIILPAAQAHDGSPG
ncbi:MAG: hypothetical protein JSV52_12885 [Candidatus Zixiibacteriota bacterium]|nr:MAG: hypothetical protein JSV52_12885 [candidate division Zixibacteria bacterium]